MNIKVTITAVLNDKGWGFSDILDGRPFDDATRSEIENLIAQDPHTVLEQGIWRIEQA
jgi:hypothetical protein